MNQELKQFYKENIIRATPYLNSQDTSILKSKVFSSIGSKKSVTEYTKNYPSFVYNFYVLASFVFMFFIGNAWVASAESVPGQKIYKLKRGMEQVQLVLTTNEERKEQLKTDFALQRIKEAEILNNYSKANYNNNEISKELSNKDFSGVNPPNNSSDSRANQNYIDHMPFYKDTEYYLKEANKQAEEAINTIEKNQKYLEKKSQEDKKRYEDEIKNFKKHLEERKKNKSRNSE